MRNRRGEAQGGRSGRRGVKERTGALSLKDRRGALSREGGPSASRREGGPSASRREGGPSPSRTPARSVRRRHAPGATPCYGQTALHLHAILEPPADLLRVRAGDAAGVRVTAVVRARHRHQAHRTHGVCPVCARLRVCVCVCAPVVGYCRQPIMVDHRCVRVRPSTSTSLLLRDVIVRLQVCE